MRSPTVLGVVAALATGIIAIVLVLALTVGEDPTAPTPGAPTAPPLASATTVAASPRSSSTPGASPAASVPAFTEPPQGLAVGQTAPRIELPLLGGATLDTRDYRGTPVWINFMATWCPQCQDELPMMESKQAQLGEALRVVLVDVGEDPEVVEGFIDSLGVQLPTAIDQNGAVQAEWGAYGLPIHFWLDAEGVIQAVLFGGAPREKFIESIITVVPDVEVE
jgi:thiol-disulfide isomerase/thioredoxin